MSESAKWIRFVEVDNFGDSSTKKWQVVAKKDEFLLGEVQWFGRWKRYAFFPFEETLFEATCLRDLAAFCEAKTREHKAVRGLK